jgi:hypothetical protein
MSCFYLYPRPSLLYIPFVTLPLKHSGFLGDFFGILFGLVVSISRSLVALEIALSFTSSFRA